MRKKQFKGFKGFTNQTLEHWMQMRKQKRDDRSQTRALFDVLKKMPMSAQQPRNLSSAVTNAITNYLKTGSLKPSEPHPLVDVTVESPRRGMSQIEPEPSTSASGIIDTPQRTIKEEEGASGLEVQDFGVVAGPYLQPYLFRNRSVDTRYGVRREGGNFVIGDSKVIINEDSDLTIKGRHFEGTQGLWELLTRNAADSKVITEGDLKTYKSIL
jgi:hypothetical protein